MLRAASSLAVEPLVPRWHQRVSVQVHHAIIEDGYMATVNRLGLVAPGWPLCLRRCGGLSDDGRGWVRRLRLPMRGGRGFSATMSDQCHTRQSAVVNISYLIFYDQKK